MCECECCADVLLIRLCLPHGTHGLRRRHWVAFAWPGPSRIAGNSVLVCTPLPSLWSRACAAAPARRQRGNSGVFCCCAACVVQGGASWAVLRWCAVDECVGLCVLVVEGVGGRVCCVFGLQVAACVARV